MRLSKRSSRNGGERLKLKRKGASSQHRAAGGNIIARNYARRGDLKAAVRPHILLQRHQDAFLDDAVHRGSSRFRIIKRRMHSGGRIISS